MPKLTEKTLEKRFKCEYCGETFRTRQGLSGHIQFKHKAAYKKPGKNKEIEMRFILSKSKYVLVWQATNGLPQETNKAIAILLFDWQYVRGLFNALGLEPTEQDLKTYLLAGLGKLFI